MSSDISGPCSLYCGFQSQVRENLNIKRLPTRIYYQKRTQGVFVSGNNEVQAINRRNNVKSARRIRTG